MIFVLLKIQSSYAHIILCRVGENGYLIKQIIDFKQVPTILTIF